MNQVQSPTKMLRQPPKEATQSAVERLAARRAAQGSGFYVVVDEYAGLDRLDRAELDEADPTEP